MGAPGGDREALFEVLSQIRDRDCATDYREVVKRARPVGTAIVVDESVGGAISIVGGATELNVESGPA